MADQIVHKGKERHCWCCGKSMGFVEDRFYDRMDTCGDRDCQREEQDAYRQQRDEAHEELDRNNGWDQW